MLLCVACDGGAKSGATKPAAAEAKADTKAADAKVADAEQADGANEAPSQPLASEPPAADADPLGNRFRDPPWFRKEIFGDKAKVLSTARSEANEAGLFKSNIIFELEDGTAVKDCADTIKAKIGDAVPEVKIEEQPDGRLKLTGAAERYAITGVCGETEGKTRAYVGYEWTK